MALKADDLRATLIFPLIAYSRNVGWAPMMRIKSGIICVLSMSLAFAFACADSGTGDDDDDTGGSGSQQQAVCGDNTCDAQEVNTCPSDCGTGGGNNNNAVCGNGMCETTKGETASSCFSDCGAAGPVCGNSMCESGETAASCPGDCGSQGSLDCTDFATLFACFACVADPTACIPPFDATSCAACVGP